MKNSYSKFRGKLLVVALLAAVARVEASENVPHEPFAQWANVPDQGQLVVRLTYEESEAYHFWADNTRHSVDFKLGGEHYGIDINQGYVSLQYGISERWAADLALGYTTVGWRFFANGQTPGTVRSTTGLMDVPFGLRYQLLKEGDSNIPGWAPTLTARFGAIVPGSFDDHIPFAPGTRSTAIEPELLARKHFGWEGLGAYADGLFRWNHTTGNDCYIVSLGLFQQINRWELDAGYRHLGSINGNNIQFDPATQDIVYPRAVREIQDSFEAGFDYRTPWHGLRMGFQSRTVFDGANTDKKFWLGGFIEMPFSLVK
ncbi:MAG TPA: hypothetical protein VN873_18345 [Candidatus Angelobacter sp.]|nr:hypothetical protein [Candidatus Angelobacter sp.]